MRYWKLVAVVLVLGTIATLSPMRADATTAPTYGDGNLPAEEVRALNALPVNSVTRAQVADVRESDLSRLDAELQRRFTTPYGPTYHSRTVTESESLRTCTPRRCDPSRSVAQYRWWRKNFFGRLLYEYTLGAQWTHNGRCWVDPIFRNVECRGKLWDHDAFRIGQGHWNWSFCGSEPAGERWIGTLRRFRTNYGRGLFTAVGSCEIINASAGGEHMQGFRGTSELL